MFLMTMFYRIWLLDQSLSSMNSSTSSLNLIPQRKVCTRVHVCARTHTHTHTHTHKHLCFHTSITHIHVGMNILQLHNDNFLTVWLTRLIHTECKPAGLARQELQVAGADGGTHTRD